MAASTMYVKHDAAGGGDGTTWAQAWNEAEFLHDLNNHAEAGDIYYVMEGAYTASAAYAGLAGSAAANVSIIGVNNKTTNAPPIYSDWGMGTARPTFTCGANAFTFGNYTGIYNIIMTAANSFGFRGGTNFFVFNCKITNTATNYALFADDHCRIISNEITSAGGCAAYGYSSAKYLFNYIHDSTICLQFYPIGHGNIILFNFFDTATTGLKIDKNVCDLILNNTFYNCTTAVSASTAYSVAAINNIIDTATDGFKWDTEEKSNFFWQNHEGASVTDMWDMAGGNVSSPFDDKTATSGDPKITNAATGKCDLASDSPCIDAGMSLTLGVTAASEMNQGAWEATTAAASGSSPRFGDMTGGLK